VPRARTISLFSAAEVAPAPVLPSTPEPVPQTQPEIPTPKKHDRRWLWAVGLLVVLIITVAAWRHFAGTEKQAGGEALRVATVEMKEFVRTVRVHGIVEAVESHSIGAPRLSGQGLGSLIITKLIQNGSPVHQGDVLVEFDRENQMRVVIDKEAEYRDLVEQIKKKQAEQAALRAADETELKQAEDAEKTAELEVKKNEIVSRIDAEKNQENLEQAQATLKQLKETFELKRKAAQAELKILEIQRDRALAAMRWAQGNTQKMVIHSSMDGVAVINSMWKAGTMSDVQEGDEVRAGFPFMQVVNPGRMQVRAKVNQADISDLREGQSVRISLDAYPDLVFTGKVERIAAVAQTSSFSAKARNVVVLFSINGKDAKLLPDLSAAVNIELERQPNVLVVPRDAIVSQNGHSYVRVKNGSGYEKQEVQLGAASDVEQVITSGVHKGAVLERNPTL
jgi:HlyD family secretion protein